MNQTEKRIHLIQELLQKKRKYFYKKIPKEEEKQKDITAISSLQPIREGIYLWKGDISTLCCNAIVNAADRGMTGCYIPLHPCVDNCIHSAAGIELRQACAEIIKKQGHKEKIGGAKITPAYNLPCKYVLHTVGPIVHGWLTKENKKQLASCYRSCLELAEKKNIQSIAFCCISTVQMMRLQKSQ